MVSRLVLGMQYLLVMYHVREYKKTKLPLALMAGLNVLAGILYLGISLYAPPTSVSFSIR